MSEESEEIFISLKDKSKNEIVKTILNKLLTDILFEDTKILKEYLEIGFKKYFSFDITVSDIKKIDEGFGGSIFFKDDYDNNINIAFEIIGIPSLLIKG